MYAMYDIPTILMYKLKGITHSMNECGAHAGVEVLQLVIFRNRR